MDVAEMADLYRKAKAVRDETVRQNLSQSIAQLAASSDALTSARDQNGAIKEDAGAAYLAEQAESQIAAATEAASKLLGSRGKSVVAARGAQLLAGEAVAAESLAAEAIAAESIAVEAAEGTFSGEPFAVEASMLEGTFAESIEAVGGSLRTFVADENAKPG